METLKVGDLVYFDSFVGMLPCKVLAIDRVGSWVTSSRQNVTVRLTAKRGAYKIGETLTVSSLHVCPRKSIKGNRIRAYQVIGEGEIDG